MDLKHFEQKLLEKQQELEAELGTIEDDSRKGGNHDVEDSAEAATSDLSTSAALEQASLGTSMLEQVREALQRIQDGTYGTCIECDRQIEPARLEAIPWTPYCMEDQEKRDKMPSGHKGPTL